MHVDARQYDQPTLDTDVCIIGAGAAGITVARTLSTSSLRTTVVESGDFERTPETDALNEGASPSIDGDYLRESRRRVFGGTTSHWTGMCMPLDPIVLEPRPWVPHSGWPIGAAELDPFYIRACELLDMPAWSTGGHVERDEELEVLSFTHRPDRFATRIYQMKRRYDFGVELGTTLRDADGVTLLTNATCTGLVPENDRIASAVVRTLTGKTVQVRAQNFVLAAGGIENARLLLLANEQRPGAVGTGHAVVGRYYMDHPELVVAETVLWPSWDLGLYFGAPLSRGRPGFGAFFPTHAYQKRAEIMVTGFQVFAGPRWGLPEDRHMDRAVASAGFHFDCARGRTLGGACLPAAFRTGLFARCEQAPDPENRVVLDERRDAFDNRLPELQWRLTGTDYASFRTATLELGKVLYADGIGRIRPLLPDRLPADLRTVYGFSLSPEELDAIHDRRTPVIRVWGHHMGATRMADTPARGVVDSDCRVHGVANLYVGGCSVFPTGGAANPTLTIVALALRLATHLRAVAGA